MARKKSSFFIMGKAFSAGFLVKHFKAGSAGAVLSCVETPQFMSSWFGLNQFGTCCSLLWHYMARGQYLARQLNGNIHINLSVPFGWHSSSFRPVKIMSAVLSL